MLAILLLYSQDYFCSSFAGLEEGSLQVRPETVATSPFFIPHARSHRAKLFSLADKRPFTPNEILGTAQGVKIFVEWAPKTE